MNNKKKVIIFGTGGFCKSSIEKFNIYDLYNVVAFADNDLNKQGKYFDDILIINPNAIKQYDFDKIIIFSSFNNEISRQLINEIKISKENILDGNDLLLDDIKKHILDYYEKYKVDEEITEIINYLKKHKLTYFNYEFVENYKGMEPNVEFDIKVNMFFVWHNNKKMYFSKSFSNKNQVIDYYKGISIEQDINSPHRYLIGNFQVNDGDIVVDAGVAEGNFALDVIDKVSKIYLIEADHLWVEALRETFKEYSSKVEIIEKFLTDFDDENHISLDSLVKINKVNFIKMDIEGSEVNALKGADNVLSNNNIKLDVCSYHRENDETEIKEILQKHGFTIEVSKGYMCYELWKADYLTEIKKVPSKIFRRGLIRGIKKSNIN